MLQLMKSEMEHKAGAEITTELRNIGHIDLHILWGQWANVPSMTFILKTVLKI